MFYGRWDKLLFCIAVSASWGACEQPEEREIAFAPPDSWEGVCVDADGDGYGFQCEAGSDCNDSDSTTYTDCRKCATPSEGCSCSDGTAAIECTVAPELTASGGLLCKEGTRYCRDEKWTECEGIVSFVAPAPSKLLSVKLQGLVDPDASTKCSVCSPDCYRVDDVLSGFDASTDSGVVAQSGGGITLGSITTGTTVDAGYLDDYSCVPGTLPDTDCDGIPDTYDTSPSAPPFQTDHKTIFMDLAPGQSGSQSLKINFTIASADVYFYLDMTSSMEGERDKLIQSLTSGNYLPSAVASRDCADRDLDGSPDNYLKSQGVAGNIACLIRDANFGTGWFRDLPFTAHGPVDFEMYEHKLDITPDVSKVLASLSAFQTRGGNTYPEGSSQGLWAIPTAGEVYAGWDRPGIPSRTDCRPGTWGAPCFRTGAVPIVIHVTDDGLYNGPPTSSSGSTYPFTYAAGDLGGMKIATPDASGRYLRPLTTSAETFATAQDFGTVDDKFITYSGNTELLNADLTYLSTGNCASGTGWSASSQGGRDAVFKFTVGSKIGSANRTIKLSASGSRFDSTLLLTGTQPSYTALAAADNGAFASAKHLGTISPGRFIVTGDTSSSPYLYSRESLNGPSDCFVGKTANDLGPASVLKFRLGADTNARIVTNAGSAVGSALFMGSALEPETIDLNTLDCGAGVSSNCNDRVGQFSLGDMSGGHAHLVNGSTNDSHVTSNYSTEFSSCGGATYSGAGDTVVDFSLSRATTMRIETTGNGSNMQAGFDHGVALVRKPAAALATSKTVANGNGDQATAYAIVEADIPVTGGYISYTGSSASDTASYVQNEVGGTTAGVCSNGNVGAESGLRDVVFRFDVTSAQKYDFDTAPTVVTSGYKTWLSLHKGSIGRAPPVASSNAVELDSATGQAVATLAQGAIDSRRVVVTGGQIDQRNVSHPPNIMGSYCGSTNNSPGGSGGRDAVYRFYATTSGQVKVSTVGPAGTPGTTPNFNSFLAVYKTSVSGANRVSSNCQMPFLFTSADQAGNGWADTINVTAGTEYFVVIKEWAYDVSTTASKGQFGLIIEDTRFASTFVGCNAGSSASGSNFSKLSASLSPGTYYLVIKGSGTSNNNYALNVRRSVTSSGSVGTTVACANSASNRATLTNVSLTAGDYALIVKGQRITGCFGFCSSEEKGSYNVTIRDLAVAPIALACSNTASSSTLTPPSQLKKNDAGGNPIDYYLVTRGNTAGAPYQVSIEDSGIAATTSALQCDDNSGQAANAELSRALAPGTYYAVLKGATSSESGMFQMSIGEDKSGVTSSGTFAPKTWQGAAGVRQGLLNKQVRVIAVNSVPSSNLARGSNAYKQTLVLAQDTGAPTVSSSVTYEIATDGTGMGSSVISAVSDLANALSMDLGLVLTSIAPNVPAKPFGFSVTTLPNPGNCAGTRDADGNGVPDTFTACGFGAVPSFRITITNPPAPNNVPLSMLDANGGYQMKLQLIGDGQYVMDEVPVYVIPKDVVPDPSTSFFTPSGSYEQIVSSLCTGTGAPNWRSLYWTANIPANTSLVWKVCSGATDAEAAICTLRTAATVTSGGACTSSSQCSDGYCAPSGRCEYVVGPACAASTECGTAGLCVANSCRWTKNPIDLMPALVGGLQGKKKMRVNLTMNASPDRLSAPSVHDWRLDYYCSPQL